ncbi:MAG: hypothetical protein GY746_09410 [Gammaproteobacteria bacterium]|nr:hypothetical protein [Gammaproteobacteria bacterium]
MHLCPVNVESLVDDYLILDTGYHPGFAFRTDRYIGHKLVLAFQTQPLNVYYLEAIFSDDLVQALTRGSSMSHPAARVDQLG